MQISSPSTHSNQLRIPDPLGQLYCSKCCTVAIENTGLIKPYMFKSETDSEEEVEELIIKSRTQVSEW